MPYIIVISEYGGLLGNATNLNRSGTGRVTVLPDSLYTTNSSVFSFFKWIDGQT